MKPWTVGLVSLAFCPAAGAGLNVDPGTNSAYCYAYVLNEMTTTSSDFFVSQQDLPKRAGVEAVFAFSEKYLPKINDRDVGEITYQAAKLVCDLMKESMLEALAELNLPAIPEKPLPGQKK